MEGSPTPSTGKRESKKNKKTDGTKYETLPQKNSSGYPKGDDEYNDYTSQEYHNQQTLPSQRRLSVPNSPGRHKYSTSSGRYEGHVSSESDLDRDFSSRSSMRCENVYSSPNTLVMHSGRVPSPSHYYHMLSSTATSGECGDTTQYNNLSPNPQRRNSQRRSHSVVVWTFKPGCHESF